MALLAGPDLANSKFIGDDSQNYKEIVPKSTTMIPEAQSTADPIAEQEENSQFVHNGTLTGLESDALHSTVNDDHQEVISKCVNAADDTSCRPIIVTGFGPILSDDSTNLSKEVVQEFYWLTNGTIVYNGECIPIKTGTQDMMKNPNNLQPVETSYRFVASDSPKTKFDSWLRLTNARLSVHLGVYEDGYHSDGRKILFEVQACNGDATFWRGDDYGTQKYGKPCEPDGCPYLQTSINIQTLIGKVNKNLSLQTAIADGATFSFIESTDAGHFLCDFLYYRSLYYAKQRDSRVQNVIFIHIPPRLPKGVTAKDLALVLRQIVYCLLDMCSCEGESETNAPIENGGERLTNGAQNQEEEGCACTGALVPQYSHHNQVLSSCDQPHCTSDQENLRDTQEIISRPFKGMTSIENAVVVTGFGPIFGNIPNQSWKIVQRFCSRFQRKDGTIEYNSAPITLMTGPSDQENQPITTAYDCVATGDFDNWLRSSNARLYIHLGVNYYLDDEPDNVFSFEKFAVNGNAGYWEVDRCYNRFPGPCVEGGESTLRTQFSDEQITELISSLTEKVTNEKINGTFSFTQSTNPGNSLCDFLYYRSLYYASLRNEDSLDGQISYVIFIHVPSRLKPNNLAGVVPMALVLNVIVHCLLDIVTPMDSY